MHFWCPAPRIAWLEWCYSWNIPFYSRHVHRIPYARWNNRIQPHLHHHCHKYQARIDSLLVLSNGILSPPWLRHKLLELWSGCSHLVWAHLASLCRHNSSRCWHINNVDIGLNRFQGSHHHTRELDADACCQHVWAGRCKLLRPSHQQDGAHFVIIGWWPASRQWTVIGRVSYVRVQLVLAHHWASFYRSSLEFCRTDTREAGLFRQHTHQGLLNVHVHALLLVWRLAFDRRYLSLDPFNAWIWAKSQATVYSGDGLAQLTWTRCLTFTQSNS